MPLASIIYSYFTWHYSRALKDALLIWRNFFLFFYHYFAFSLLLKTIFQPWRKLKEYYGSVADIENFFESLVVNTVMRFVGFFIKTAIICLALTAEIIVFFAGIILILIWFFAPLLAFLLINAGIYHLFI